VFIDHATRGDRRNDRPGRRRTIIRAVTLAARQALRASVTPHRKRRHHRRGCQGAGADQPSATTAGRARGAIVLKEVPADCTFVGTPAGIVRKKQPQYEWPGSRFICRPDAGPHESLYVRLTHMERCLAKQARRMAAPRRAQPSRAVP
jgi:hypothetical protein